MSRALLLVTGEAPAGCPATYPEVFQRLTDVRLEVVDLRTAREHDRLLALDDVSAVIVTGSAAMVDEDTEWMRYGARVLRAVLEREVALLAVCFGHQLLARAVGAEVSVNPAGRAFGTQRVTIDLGLPFLPRGDLEVQVAHRDVIISPGPLEVIGGAPHDDHHVVRAGPRAFGLQFHPEFDAEFSRGVIDARRAILDDEGLDADALRAAVRPTERAARVVTDFVTWAMS